MSLQLQNLTISYAGHPAVHHLSGAFQAGQSTAIVGPNGSGKTSLMQVLAGQNTQYQGQIQWPSPWKMAYLPQQASLNMDMPITVQTLVGMGLWQQTGWFGRLSHKHRHHIHHALHQVGLDGFEQRQLATLSTGQVQRALFARLIVQNADWLLLDEPFNAVDEQTTADLLTLLSNWQQAGRTVVAVLHDMAQVHSHFSHTLLLAREPLAWGPTAQVLNTTTLERAHTMAQSWTTHAPVCRQAA